MVLRHVVVLRQARHLVALRCCSKSFSSHPFADHRAGDDDFDRELPPHLLQIMERRISSLQQRHSDLLSRSSSITHDPNGSSNSSSSSSSSWIQTNRELSQLSPSIQLIQSLRAKQHEIHQLRSMAADPHEDRDLRHMATDELTDALREERRLLNSLFRSLLPKDDADHRDCILEVRAGTGGEEASLFAMDIFKMYT